MRAALGHVTRWTVRIVTGLALLLALTAAGLWWWSGQQGSLEWLLEQLVRRGVVQGEGARGAVRGRWEIDRLVWVREGLRVEAEDVFLDWEPTAVLRRTLELEQVRAARVRIVDTRPQEEPMQPPQDLRLPWRVQVDRLEVGQFSYVGRTTVEGTGLQARYAFDGREHSLKLQSLKIAGGDYQGELSLLAVPPLTVDARLSGRFQAPVPGIEERVPLAFELQAQGPASAIDLQADLRVLEASARRGGLPQAHATARLAPFERMPVPRGEADFRQLDLAMFWPAAPRTLLSGRVEVAPAGSDSWKLQADLRNAAAGPWDQGLLPVTTARGEGEWRDGMALVRTLHAQAGGGSVSGSGRWEDKGWSFEGRVEDVDPARLHGSLAPLPLTGPLKLQGEGQAVAFDLALQAGAARARSRAGSGPAGQVVAAADALALRRVAAQGRWSGDQLSLRQLHVQTSDADLEGQVELALAQRAGSGNLRLQAPGLQAQAQGSLSATRGEGSARLVSGDIALARRWLARWPGLADLVQEPQLRGQAQLEVKWQGGWRDPVLQARATGDELAWQPPAGRDGAAAQPWVLRDLALQVKGRLRDAALELRAKAVQGRRAVELAATGTAGGTLGEPGAPWRGEIASLALQLEDAAISPGAWHLQLRKPVDWRWAGGDFTLAGGEAVLRAPAGASGDAAGHALLAWAPVRRQDGQLSTTGRLSGLPLSWIELLGGPQLAGSALSGDMAFDAEWNAQLGKTLRVDASLTRVRGDVNVLAESVDGAAARVSAGVREARLTLSSEGEQLVLTLLWDSERAGHVEGQVRTRLVRTADGGWEWPAQAPVSGRLQASLPRIGVWSLLAPPGWRLRGALSADIAVSGTRAAPQLSGPVVADDLALRSVVEGIELRNGRLRARLQGQRLVVDEFLLRGSEEGGGGGTLLAYGEGAWTPQGPVFEANAQLSQLRASLRGDRQLTLSGPLTARMDSDGTTITGQLKVDRARIRIPEETAPRLGEDVVVRQALGLSRTDAERRQRPSAPGGRDLRLDIAIDLGPDFRVTGRGLDTRMAGSVQVRGDSLGNPRITGQIHAVGGTYEAYGQRMKIERGELRFTGPADNPALDILALRPNTPEKVGVLVTGRAQSPHVELYSEAGLSDAETLAQVVLGRSTSGGGAETALLQRAATALLAGRGGDGQGLVARLGLDDLSVRPDSTSGAVVRVGKRFADNFYAAYERSLSGAMGTLFIFYDISRRVTLRAEAGERTGLDLIFTFGFDRIRKR